MKNIKSQLLKPLLLVAFSIIVTTLFSQVTVDANTTISSTGLGNNDHIELTKLVDSLRTIGLNGTSVTAATNAIQFLPDTVHVNLTGPDSNFVIDLGAGTDTITTAGTMDVTGHSVTINNTVEDIIHNGDLTTNDIVTIDISDDFNGTGKITLTGTSDLSITAADTINHSGNFNATNVSLIAGDITSSGTITASGNFILNATSLGSIQAACLITGTSSITTDSLVMGANLNSGASAISITTNTITGLNITGTNTLVIEPATNSTTIGIGAGSTGTLNFDAAEIAGINTGFSNATIGISTGTGAIDIQAFSFTDPLILEAGSGIATLNGDLNAAANTVDFNCSLTLAGNYTITSGGLDLNDNTYTSGVNTLTTDDILLNNEDWQLTVSGTTAGQFGVIDVTGSVTLTNSTLNVSGAYTASGADVIQIITNDGGGDAIVGTFNGLAEGAVVGNGWSITYVGGNGNDVELYATPGAEINLLGNALTIPNGDVTPIIGDSTDFENVNVLVTSSRTYTIENIGTANLNLTGVPNMVFLIGSSDFNVTTQPTGSTIAASGNETFTITYTPTSAGGDTATVYIYNDDADENPYTFEIVGTGINNEINVTGLGSTISNGDITPTTTDDTDFGDQTISTTSTANTFTIENTALIGGPNLVLTGPVTISGANAADFTISSPATSPITPTNSTSFDVTFTPSGLGVRYAVISIPNDDDDENPYTFTIQGNGASVQEIDVQGNSISIVDGDNTPDGSDDTDFGTVGITAGTKTNTFTIENTGGTVLNVTNISVTSAVAGVFTITANPAATTVAPGGTITFDVTYNPTAIIATTETVTILCDDADEATYTFDLTGTGSGDSDVKISDTPNSTTLCTGTITDSDAQGDGDYEDNEDFTYTISIGNADQIGIMFISDALFQIEGGSGCGWTSCTCDYLEVNYGPTTGIVRYCDWNKPTFGSFIYGDPGADIVLHFVSDGGVDKDGFTIDWEKRILANVTTTDILCNGDSDGEVIVDPTPGTSGHGNSPYSYEVDALGVVNYTSTDTTNGLAIGGHTVAITDAGGCLFDTTITLTQPTVLVMAETHNDESCPASADGNITISATGGTAPYSYSFNGSGFSATNYYSGISNGIFSAQVMDSNGCIDSQNVTFNVGVGGAPSGTANLTGNDFFCIGDNSSHSFNVTGITGAGSYTWSFDSINGTTAFPTITTGAGTDLILCDMSAVTDSIWVKVDASNGCGSIAPDSMLVYPSDPGVSFVMAPATVSNTAGAIALGTQGTPFGAGGVYSGPGVVSAPLGLGDFYPATAGDGVHTLTFTYTDANGCIHVETDNVTVAASAGFFTGASNTYCFEYDASGDNIVATEAFGENLPPSLPQVNNSSHRRNINRGFNIDGGATGIATYDGLFTCTIDPSQLTNGNHALNYTYTRQKLKKTSINIGFGTINIYNTPWENIGTETITQDIYIDSIGQVTINGTTFACIDNGVVTYTPVFDHISGNGTWSAQETPYPTAMLSGFNTPTPASATIDPAVAGVGGSPYRIIYDYASTANAGLSTCSASDTIVVVVAPIPTPSFTLNPYYSVEDGGFATNPLPDNSGSYNGLGMAGEDFYPSIAGPGSHQIIYNYGDGFCTSADTNSTFVIDNTGFISNLNTTYCYEDAITTITGSPNGGGISGTETGTFSIDATFNPLTNTSCIVNTVANTATFDPTIAGQGEHKVVFSWNDQSIPFSTSQIVFVDSIGDMTIIQSLDSSCNDDSNPVIFTGTYNHAAGIGQWSAFNSNFTVPIYSGFDTINPTTSNIYPNIIDTVNSPYQIVYEYTSTDHGSGCVAYDTTQFIVHPLPTPSFTLNPYYSEQNVLPNDLFPTPDGITNLVGNFTVSTGGGISGSDFYPTIAGSGGHVITYTYLDTLTGCSNSISDSTFVIANTGSITGLTATHCYEDPIVTITGSPNGGGISGTETGTFSIGSTEHFPGSVTASGTNQADFNPALAGQGEHVITFSWTDQSIPFSTSQTIFVDSIGGVSIIAIDSTCISDNSLVDFIAQYSHANGIGAWTSIANSFDTVSSIYATLNPSLAGTGVHDILYEYTSTDNGSGCLAHDTAQFIVHALPILTFDLDSFYSEFDAPHNTLPSPDGSGNYSGAGMVDSVFYPTIAGPGGHNISYWYESPLTGCSDVAWDSTFVIANTGLINSLDPTYCYDGIPDTLYGTPNTGHGLYGDGAGTFSIAATSNSSLAIVNLGPDTAVFYPNLAGPGDHIITYSYTDQVAFTVEQTIFVDSIGPVYFEWLDNLHEYCLDSVFEIDFSDEVPTTGTGAFSYSGSATFTNNGNIAELTTNFVETATVSYLYTSNLNNSGCTADTSETITIHDLPVLSFDLLSNYCTNDSSVLVVGNPLGGSFSGNGTFVVDTNYTTQDSVEFIPGNTVGNFDHTLTYTYTDINGCTNSTDSVFTMHTAPTVQIDLDTLRIGYCELTDPSYPVTGLINGNNIDEGYFWGPGIVDVDSTDGHAEFITNNVAVGTGYEVYYTYTDTNNCYDVDSAFVDVWALPTMALTGMKLSRQYCNNHDIAFDPQLFEGFPQITPGTSGIFVLDGVVTAADQSSFDPTAYINNVQETIEISYTHTDDNGCINVAEDTVYVNPAAHPNFTISGNCIVDTIVFTDVTISPPFPDSLSTWTWTINDSTYYTQNASHMFLSDGNYSSSIEITTAAGCVSDTTVFNEYGDKPTSDFYWVNECFDPLVPVMFYESTSTISNLDTLSFSWDFGDGIGTANIPDTNYFYGAAGEYNVELEIFTNFGCADTITKLVSVKPLINTYPYFTDFQAGPDNWTAKTIVDFDPNNSWSHDVWFKDQDPANLSWATANQTDSVDYNSDERTYVSSPCFDFSALVKPMIRFDMWRDFADIGDGAVVESSIDNGQTWQVIGNEQSIDAGINWYNQVVINNGNGPGGDLLSGQPLGWSDIKDTTWFEVRHDLDHLIGHSKVMFRVAFNANAAGEDKGFAFDNVWIGERSKYVLVEHFTNTSCSPCAVTSSHLNPFITQYKKDIIDLQYHTNAIAGDILYGDYQTGPSTRELFYGASQLPQTITDGNILNATTTSWVSDSLITRRRALTSAVFDIDLVKTVNGNDITLDATITTGQNFDGEVDVYMAVIEKEISAPGIVNAGGSVLNGETEFKNVVKAMLPDAGGTRISTPWLTGDSHVITETWNSLSTNFYDLGNDDIEMVVFVQNASTKEIYQAATTDTSFIEIVIGVEEEDQTEFEKEFSFNLYPNPTSGNLFLMFNQDIRENAQVHIFNELGSLVEQRQLSNGIGSSFSTENYSEGIYFMSVVYNNQRFTKRFMVIK